MRVAERSALYSFFLKILMLPSMRQSKRLIPRLNDELNRCVFDCQNADSAPQTEKRCSTAGKIGDNGTTCG